MSAPKIRTCLTCGNEFTPTRGRRYCSELCWPSRRSILAGPDGLAPEGAMDREEILALAWAAARRGSVPAMRLLLQEMKSESAETEPRSVIDELTARRERGTT